MIEELKCAVCEKVTEHSKIQEDRTSCEEIIEFFQCTVCLHKRLRITE